MSQLEQEQNNDLTDSSGDELQELDDMCKMKPEDSEFSQMNKFQTISEVNALKLK